MGMWLAIGIPVLVVLALMLVVDVRDRNFRPRFSRAAARNGRRESMNAAVLRGSQMQQRNNDGYGAGGL
jgi:hypothetical protein